MKKFALSFVVIAIFTAYAVHDRAEQPSGIVLPTPAGLIRATDTPTPDSPTTVPADTTAPAPTASPKPKGKYRDGEYTGDVTDAFYGNVQVKAIISGGKITDVQFLDYPQDRRTSIEINSQAMPFLKSEAIQAQSAQVDGVSGATQTSLAFVESLQSALDRAKN